jgi:phosphoribosylaminoimidazole-succinocarboxamide synthase
MNTVGIFQTKFDFDRQSAFYRGKICDVYEINSAFLVLVKTDRISAFDSVFPQIISYKGMVLNEISNYFFEKTKHICKNWVLESPHQNVTIGQKYNRLPFEFIVRSHLDGYLWRKYSQGKRRFWNLVLPDKLKYGEKLPQLIFNVTTKSEKGPDLPISYERVINANIVSKSQFFDLREKSFELYQFAAKLYKKHGLILADTKFEFSDSGVLLDEIFTPDSSRLYEQSSYLNRLISGRKPEMYSKEIFREAIISSGFNPNMPISKDNRLPIINRQIQELISQKYVYVYEKLFGKVLPETPTFNYLESIETKVQQALNNLV